MASRLMARFLANKLPVNRKKGPRGQGLAQELAERASWIAERLYEYRAGVHKIGKPAVVLDSALPPSLEAVYREFDGGELFHESLVLFPSGELSGSDARLLVGEYAGDDIYVDPNGRVFRLEQDTDELLPEGTRFDRWLAGVVDAEALLYELDGEFRDEVFDEEGELTIEVATLRERRQLKRDPGAIAPRWRLARALSGQDNFVEARTQLERVVEQQPDFSWAWFDLARISEELQDLSAASEEAEQAYEAAPAYEHAAFFLAHAARLADAAGQGERAQNLAAKTLRLDPDLPRRHREGARELLEAGETESARELLVAAKVVSPRDLETLDLLRQIES